MRIPRAHDLTLALCERFGLELRPFMMGNPEGLVHVGGQRMTAAEATADPDRLGFEVAEHERGRPCDDLWEAAIADERDAARRPTARRAGRRSCSAATSTRSTSS